MAVGSSPVDEDFTARVGVRDERSRTLDVIAAIEARKIDRVHGLVAGTVNMPDYAGRFWVASDPCIVSLIIHGDLRDNAVADDGGNHGKSEWEPKESAGCL
jgi:hypothetical protein